MILKLSPIDGHVILFLSQCSYTNLQVQDLHCVLPAGTQRDHGALKYPKARPQCPQNALSAGQTSNRSAVFEHF